MQVYKYNVCFINFVFGNLCFVILFCFLSFIVKWFYILFLCNLKRMNGLWSPTKKKKKKNN